jgi:hypothetical protein
MLARSIMRNTIPILFVAATVLVGCQSPSTVHTQTAAATVAAPAPFRPMLITTLGTNTTSDGAWQIVVSDPSLGLSHSAAAHGEGWTGSGWITTSFPYPTGMTGPNTGWTAQAGWFVFIESNFRVWAYDGDRLLMLQTYTPSTNGAAMVSYYSPRFPCAVPTDVVSRLSEKAQKVIQSHAMETLSQTGPLPLDKTTEIRGQILVSDNGKIQKTGEAPIWVYDATNVQLTANIALPDFGGRTRQDLARIRANYPGVLLVLSNYNSALQKADAAEMEYRTVNGKYWDKKNALKGQTSGPDYKEVQKLEAETKNASDKRWRARDDEDDQGELIFYWFNINPGILYASLPPPLTVAETDKNGNFNFTLQQSKNVLLAVHIQGSINGQPGHYFWLLPVSSETKSNNVVLNSENVRYTKSDSELKPVQIFVLDAGVIPGTPHRIRDTQQTR